LHLIYALCMASQFSLSGNSKLHARTDCTGGMGIIPKFSRSTHEHIGKDHPVLFALKSQNSHISGRQVEEKPSGAAGILDALVQR
jgi:hypothetical protein